ncbi:MAG: catalase, partial [Ilumatobacteraceae bacterium]
AKDFVNDAHAHCKFIGYSPGARALLDAAGLTDLADSGYVTLDAKKSTATNFIKTCRQLRFWDREPTVKSV